MGVRLQPNELAALDAWIAQRDQPLTRPEAIRAMMDTVLVIIGREPGAKPRLSQKNAAKAKALAARTIDRLVDPEAGPEEKAVRKRRLLKGPSEFREVRIDRAKAKKQ